MDLGKLLGNILGFFNQGTKRVAGNVKAGMVLRGGVDDYSEQTKKKLDEATRLAKQALQSQDSNKRKLLTDLSRRASGEGMTLDEQMKNQLQQKAGMTFQQGLDQPSYLKQGLGVATDAATWLLPGSGSLGKAAALGAGLGASRAVSEEQDPLTGSLLGGAFGAGGYGAGKVIGKGFEKLSKELSLKGIRIKPTQYRDLKKLVGKDPADWIREEGLIGKKAGDVSDILDNLQTKYDDLAMKSGTKIKVNDVVKAFQDKIDELAAQPNTASQSQAQKLAQEMAAFTNKFKNKKNIDIKDITLARKGIDNFLREPAFKQSSELAGPLKLARDTYKKIIDKATKNATDEIGQKMNKYINFKKILESQEGLGKGSLLANIPTLLGMSAGPSILGVKGYQEGGPQGAIAGALAGAALTKGINNPATLTALSKMGLNLGQFFQSPAVGGALEKGGRFVGQKANELVDTITQRGSQPIAEPTTTQQRDTSTNGKLVKVGDEEFLLEGNKYYSQDKAWVFDEKLDDWVENPEYQSEQTGMADSDQTKQLFTLLMMQDLQQTGGKNITELKTIFDMVAPEAASTKKPTEAETARAEAKSLIDNAMQSLESGTINVGPMGMGSRLEQFLGKFDAGDEETLEFNTNIAALKASIAKARAGTSFTPNEERLLNQYTPNVGDSIQQLRTKLNNLQQIFSKY